MNIFSLFALALLQAASLPTMDDIRTAFQGKKFADVNRMVAQVMPSATKGTGGYDRGELLEMKGEASLQLKQFSPAVAAFRQASTLMKDEKVAAIDRATATLIQASPGGKYVPKAPSTAPSATGRQMPLDVIDTAARKQAMSALYADQSKQLTTQTATLAKANNPATLMKGLQQIGDIRSVELAATGDDKEYQAAVTGIVDHAGQLMGDALKPMSDTVDSISKRANASAIQTVPGQRVGAILIDTKNGLTSTDKNELSTIIDNATEIAQACDAFSKTGSKSAALDTAKSSATALAQKAKTVLEADYSSTVQNTGNPPMIIQNPGTIQVPGTVKKP